MMLFWKVRICQGPGQSEAEERHQGWGGQEQQEQHEHDEEAEDGEAEETFKTSAKDPANEKPAVDKEAATNHEPAATDVEHAVTDDEPSDDAANDDRAAEEAVEPGSELLQEQLAEVGDMGKRTS